MKKTLLSALAAGALTIGSAASAQDLGSIVSSIFGFGNPYPSYSTGIPAVVAGTQPYYGSTPYYGNNTVYVDQYGRQVQVDQYGRQVIVQPGTSTYGITGYDAWGRPVYGQTYGNYGSYGNYAYSGRSWDRDGDGIANTRDRWPDDRRYY